MFPTDVKGVIWENWPLDKVCMWCSYECVYVCVAYMHVVCLVCLLSLHMYMMRPLVLTGEVVYQPLLWIQQRSSKLIRTLLLGTKMFR